MQITRLKVLGYRSIKNIELKLDALNVICGANGTGKSNLYRSLHLVSAAANGQLAQMIAHEGGMDSALWAGKKSKLDPANFSVAIDLDDLSYRLECGRVPDDARVFAGAFKTPEGSRWFGNDPDVKRESVSTDYRGKQISILKRKRSHVTARNMDGRAIEYPLTGNDCESVLSCLREPHLFPDLAVLRQEFLGWRFYHHFRTDLHSPLRRQQIPVFTPVLSHSGNDLASALATIIAAGGEDLLSKNLERAFPGAELEIEMERRAVSFKLQMPGLSRPFSARELSDGTLQYLCLLAALCTERPPNLMVLNEPETSIHPDLFEPLAELLVAASKRSQLIVTTHALPLAQAIEKIKGTNHKIIELDKVDGETRVIGSEPAQYDADDLEDDD
ncbi:MAG: AAA family ATPase [Candidatus Obscuribacterales bacterium]